MVSAPSLSLCAHIDGIGLLGPGFENWPGAAEALRGTSVYVRRPTVLPPPLSLPAAERRRAGDVVRLALAVGFEAAAHAGADAAELLTVFASSGADGRNCHEICETLATTERQISPTRFHNSVHNAAAGYWSIASRAMTPSNVISAFDASFAAGLLEALSMLTVENKQVLLLAYDTPYPEPLHEKRPVPDAFGIGLVLAPAASDRSIARMTLELSDETTDAMTNPQMEALRASIPAARSLPLLQRLAKGEPGQVILDYLNPLHLTLEVSPCG